MKKITKRKSRMYNDPIFDNNYNKGEIEYKQFDQKVEIDNQYLSSRLDDCYNAHDTYRKAILNEEIDKIFQNSKWRDRITIKKKIPKYELAEVFHFIREKIEDTTYSEIEIFIEIADYLDLKYKILYDMVSNNQKRKLLLELEESFSMIDKIKKYKLF